MQRKSEEFKKRIGTFKPSREAKRKVAEDPERDLAFAREMLAAMRLNITLASQAIKEHGMVMTFYSKNKNLEIVAVEKSNPALAIQKRSIREISRLKNEIASLEEQVERLKNKQAEDAEWNELLETN